MSDNDFIKRGKQLLKVFPGLQKMDNYSELIEQAVTDNNSDRKAKPLLERLRGFEYLALDHICCEAAERIRELEEETKKLKYDLRMAEYEHWCTMDSEGLTWYGDIPEYPEQGENK